MLRDQLQLGAVEKNIILCTFVVNDAASTMTSPAQSSCLTIHNGLFVWLLHTGDVQNLHSILPVECIFDKE